MLLPRALPSCAHIAAARRSVVATTVVARVTRALSTSAPQPPPLPPLRYIMYEDARRAWRRWRLVALGAAVGLGGVAASVLYALRPSANVDAVFDAFVRGACPDDYGQPAVDDVPRPELHAALTRVLRPAATEQYVLIAGERGTGKSTELRRAAHEAGSDGANGANGVVYYPVSADVRYAARELAALVGFRANAAADAKGGAPARRTVSQRAHGERPPPTDAEPRATWARLGPALQAAATQFRSVYGRPATLVLDGVDRVAARDVDFLALLQDFASDCADAGALRVVFVSSDSTAAPAVMARRPAWSRAAAASPETEVGDIPDGDAVRFVGRWGVTDPDVAGAWDLRCCGDGWWGHGGGPTG
jgi:hypothetical protein